MFLDGFMSSLGCKTKERIGHLYRGRDCENNVVDDGGRNIWKRNFFLQEMTYVWILSPNQIWR